MRDIPVLSEKDMDFQAVNMNMGMVILPIPKMTRNG